MPNQGSAACSRRIIPFPGPFPTDIENRVRSLLIHAEPDESHSRRREIMDLVAEIDTHAPQLMPAVREYLCGLAGNIGRKGETP